MAELVDALLSDGSVFTCEFESHQLHILNRKKSKRKRETNMNRNDFILELNKYKAYNFQELKDKYRILKFLKENDNAYLRDNEKMHMTASSWIINKEKTKVLMIYHNIYDSWSWTGGHCDGDEDLMHVALKEAKEETNIKNVKLVNNNIYSIEILKVNEHIKNGIIVKKHLHANVTYLLEALESDEISAKLDEAKDTKWIKIEDIKREVKEKWMYKHIYKKLIKKLKRI